MEINTQLCPDCDCPLDHLSTFGDGPQAYRICPVCNPATYDVDTTKEDENE
jgi:hypothetical protein